MNAAELRYALSKIEERYFTVEGHLKKVEFLKGEAMTAAFFSLRYAGRQLVRVISIGSKQRKSAEELKILEDSIQNINHYLDMVEDDIFDGIVGSINVRHDFWIEIHDQTILSLVDDYNEFLSLLSDCKEKIIETRECIDIHERKRRYDYSIKHSAFSLYEIYKKIEKNGITTATILHEKREKRHLSSRAIGEIGVIFGLLGFLPDIVKLFTKEDDVIILNMAWQACAVIAIVFAWRNIKMLVPSHSFVFRILSSGYFFWIMLSAILLSLIAYNFDNITQVLKLTDILEETG